MFFSLLSPGSTRDISTQALYGFKSCFTGSSNAVPGLSLHATAERIRKMQHQCTLNLLAEVSRTREACKEHHGDLGLSQNGGSRVWSFCKADIKIFQERREHRVTRKTTHCGVPCNDRLQVVKALFAFTFDWFLTKLAVVIIRAVASSDTVLM